MTTTYLSPLLVQRFWSNSATPLVNGQIFTYAAGTTTPLVTYTDSTGGTPNANPVILNARGEASIWIPPNVAYKFVVQDSGGNTLPGGTIDNVVNAALVSLFGGTDTGIANSYILNFASPVPANTDGQVIYFRPSNSNTGPSVINVNGGGFQPILNPNGSQLGANQLISGQFASIVSISGQWQLYGGSGAGVNVGTFGMEVPIPSAATTDLGSAPAHVVAITGTTTITSFGASAQTLAPIYIVRFTGSLTLTQSASLLLPGGNSIVTQIGDALIAEYAGMGNWRVLVYQPASAVPVTVSVKAADTPVTSSTTLTADPDLSVTLLKGQYQYELFLLFDSVAAGAGFKFQSNGSAPDSRSTSPAVATGFVNSAAYGPKLESFVGSTITYATVSVTPDSDGVLYKGSLLVSTAGTFGISWAQSTSTASATTLRAGSYLTATLLGQKGTLGLLIRLYSVAGTAFETVPSGYSTCYIEEAGGSGLGGSAFGSHFGAGGGGGGSGGYCSTTISVAGQGGKTMQYTVGARGIGGTPNGTASVVQSGTLTITTMTAGGGSVGGSATSSSSPGAGGAGGTASGGTINTPGNAGGPGQSAAGGAGGGTGGFGIPGTYDGGAQGGFGADYPIGGPPDNPGPGGPGFVVFAYSP